MQRIEKVKSTIKVHDHFIYTVITFPRCSCAVQRLSWFHSFAIKAREHIRCPYDNFVKFFKKKKKIIQSLCELTTSTHDLFFWRQITKMRRVHIVQTHRISTRTTSFEYLTVMPTKWMWHDTAAIAKKKKPKPCISCNWSASTYVQRNKKNFQIENQMIENERKKFIW